MMVDDMLKWRFRKISEALLLRLGWEGWEEAAVRETVGRLFQSTEVNTVSSGESKTQGSGPRTAGRV